MAHTSAAAEPNSMEFSTKTVKKNARVGATFSLPLTQHQSLKLAWAKGVTTRIGGDLNMFAVGWQYVW
jgi:hypothetical protein